MKYNREIERKFILNHLTYNEAMDTLFWQAKATAFEITTTTVSKDWFWKAPNVDFIRLRENSLEMTIKVTDKGTTVDRIEENVVVDRGSLGTSKAFLTKLFGPSCLSLTKEFIVLEYMHKGSQVTLSLYTVKEDELNRVFFEVEGASLESVDSFINEVLPDMGGTVETRSLFNIFNK